MQFNVCYAFWFTQVKLFIHFKGSVTLMMNITKLPNYTLYFNLLTNVPIYKSCPFTVKVRHIVILLDTLLNVEVQWNLCIMDTLGPTKSVLIIKVSCMIFQVSLYDKASFGTTTNSVDYAGVLIFKFPD